MATNTPLGEPWRDRVREAPVEPDLPIIDAHHHLWPEPPAEQFDPYGQAELASEKVQAGHRIVATVFVEGFARYKPDGPAHLRCTGETEYAHSVGEALDAAGPPLAGGCAALVVAVDLEQGPAVVEEQIRAHLSASPRVRGVRSLVMHDIEYGAAFGAVPGRLADPRVRAALSVVARHGLSLDLWVAHTQLPEVAALAAAMPELRVVIDHVGAPMGVGRFAGRRDAAFGEWKANLALAAAEPNVLVKLGGLNMDISAMAATPDHDERPWTSDEMAAVHGRYLRTAIELFGADRAMFESNFPVDRYNTGGSVLWNSFKKATADLSSAERRALFFGTADAAYRLGITRPD